MIILESIKACFLDAVLKEGYIWFFDNRIQALCKMSTDNFKMEIISVYRGEERFNVRKIFFFQNKFYLVSTHSPDILIYDNNRKDKGSAFQMQKPLINYASEIYAAYGYADYIYFFPSFINGKIICFDIYTKKYFEKSLFDSSIKAAIGKQTMIMGYSSFHNGKLFFPVFGTSFYMSCDLGTYKTDLFQTEDKRIMLSGSCFDGENIWLTQKDESDIICIGKESINILEKYTYSWLYNIDDFIIMLLNCNDKLLLIHKETAEVSIVTLPFIETEKQQKSKGAIVNCCDCGDFVFLFRHGAQDLYVFYKKTMKVKRIDLYCEDYAEICFSKKKNLLNEEDDIGLRHLTRCLKPTVGTMRNQEEGKTIGEKIWNNIKKDA